MLSLPRVQVQSLVGELRSHKPRSVAKNQKERKKRMVHIELSNVMRKAVHFKMTSGRLIPVDWNQHVYKPLLPGRASSQSALGANE